MSRRGVEQRAVRTRGRPFFYARLRWYLARVVRAAIFTALLLLAACRDDRPPAPTAEQSDQLNQAENLLNAEAANEKGPENPSGPSR